MTTDKGNEMSYTPTTQQVEDGFAHEPEYEYHNPVGYGSHVQSNRRAFKRWLDALILEAKAEAWDEGYWQGINGHTGPGNPYRDCGAVEYREGSET